MKPKPLLIIQPATSYDDMPELCAEYGDEVDWFSQACGVDKCNVVAIKVYEGEEIPSPDEFSAAIITGAIDMVTDGHDWIKYLVKWTKGAVSAGLPILGVCFGHQLLAFALGGRVGSNPNGASFGNVTVEKHKISESDCLFKEFPVRCEMKVFHYQSVIAVPPSSSVLIRGDNDPFYAVRYAPNVWGVQFHPEFDNFIMDKTFDVYSKDMEENGYCIQNLRERNTDDGTGRRFLKRFGDLFVK
ncbi:MAG: glutamine amidotransferase [Cellvibrionaceae bacterium]|nr:glutamine amidotransferase [Cellvibrionaceae bacterium]